MGRASDLQKLGDQGRDFRKLSDGFDVEFIRSARGRTLFVTEHLSERGERHFDLGIVRFPGREFLKRESRPDQRPEKRIIHLAGAEFNQFIGNSCYWKKKYYFEEHH